MERRLSSFIKKDLKKKIILLSGPRQTGKTTLSKTIDDNVDYFNFDRAKDRQSIKNELWNRESSFIIFDELHKMKSWKRWLKGIYDTEGIPPGLFVTGSAKLNTFKKVGDSLAGRFFSYRLYPFDLKEINRYDPKNASLERLLTCSGFPEPYLENKPTYYKRWQKSHLDIILRQDLVDLNSVQDIVGIETLIELLKERAGQQISYENLARDLGRDGTTIKRWLTLLENLYIVFKVTPYAQNIARSIRKQPIYYFYDTAIDIPDEGLKLENVVANALLKELHFKEDTQGTRTSLHYARTKEGKEIDFVVVQDKTPTHLIEVKQKDAVISSSFDYFRKYFPDAKQIQLVRTLDREFSNRSGVRVKDLETWLKKVPL